VRVYVCCGATSAVVGSAALACEEFDAQARPFLFACGNCFCYDSQVRIHMWFIKQAASKLANAPTVVFFHGNAGNIGFRLPLLKALFDQLGCNILAVQYRGYGNSEGTPSEHGLTKDAQAALDWLSCRTDIDLSKVFLYGQSLGGGVSIKTAHSNQDKLAGVMVENTFTSIDDMVLELGQHSLKVPWIVHFRTFFAFFLTR
jgi:pimeloyl-ACP methyl ester carboxylesterase